MDKSCKWTGGVRSSLQLIWLLLLLGLTMASVWAQPDTGAVRASIVQVTVLRGGDIERLGSGFVVSDGGYVLTAAHLVADESSIYVVPLSTGTELRARLLYIDERSGLAVLAVNGLTLPSLQMARDAFGPGRLVYSAGVWSDTGGSAPVAGVDGGVSVSLAEGSVGRKLDLFGEGDVPAVPLLEHNATVPDGGYGGPLLNECGNVVGLNRGAPNVSRWRLRRGIAPEGVGYALRATAIVGLLQPQGVQVAISDEPCTGALAAARAETEASRAQLRDATVEVQETRRRLEETVGEAEATREQLEQAVARATEAESLVGDLEAQYNQAVRTGDAEADALRVELQAAQSEQERTRAAVGSLEEEMDALQQRLNREAAAGRSRLMWIGVGVFALLLVLGVAMVFVHRRRTRQVALAEAAAERARQDALSARADAERLPHPDCLLAGQNGEGLPVSLMVPGRLLGGNGAIIGRSPRNSMLLIDDQTLSREHARLFVEDDALHLEDLGSTNGTWVNGRELRAGAPVRVRQGDTIEFGAVRVELSNNG